tara:strand:- start:1727 stop:3832 length:2106 start_codon:yes stop_codon:yes gene_type:complete
MDLEITSKLLKYSPSDVQSVTYVIEYAEHNFTGEARYAYLEERLVTPTEKAIAEVIIEGKKGLWDNIHAKRKRGEAPAKKGDKDYPKTLNVEHHEKDENGKVIEHDVEDDVTEGSAYGIYKGDGVDKIRAPRMQKGAMAYDGPNKAASEARDRILAKTKAKRAKIKEETSNAATLNNKPSAASPKIDTPKEKQSTVDPQCENQRSIKAKGSTPKTQVEEGLKQARKNVGADKCWDGYVAKGTKKKNGKDVPNCVPANEEWVWDVVDELGEEFDILTDQDLQDVVVEALLDFESEQYLSEALDILDGFELLVESDKYYDSAVKSSKDAAARINRGKRAERLKGAASKAGSIVKKGLGMAGRAAKAGAKAGAKGAVRGAGYASGLAQRAGSAAKREFSQGRQRGLGGSSGSSGGSSSGGGGSSSSNNRPVSTGGDSRPQPQSGGGSSAPKKKAGPGLLSRAAGAVGRGLRKAVGAGAKAAGKVAVGGAKLAGKAAVGTAKVAGKAAVGTAKVAGKTAVGGAKLAGKAVGKTAQAAGSVAKAGGKAAVGTAKAGAKVVGKTASAAGSAVKKTGSAVGGAVKKTGQAAGNLGKKVIGKTSRAISKGSDKLARKLGEETMTESRVDKVRRLALAQETFEHDIAQARNPDADSWRERLAYSKYIAEQPTPEQLKKREVLKQTKDLTNKGKHKEASELFKKNFPNFGK